jgi:dTDP-4-amino-4,6-dideoxygalactose transaminase
MKLPMDKAHHSTTVALEVPLLDLKAQFATIREEVMVAVARVMESQRFILGPEVEQLEAQMAALVGTKFAIGCASGSDALILALTALGIGPGDEVITTPFTFFASAGSIARVGAHPVFIDIDSATYNVDPASIRKAITARTKAIMPVHLFGLAADMDEIMRVAAEHGLVVIEDAAQAIGAEHGGRPAGSIGRLGCFSFFPTKNLGGGGDGGLIATSDADIADRVRMLRVHGERTRYHYQILGVNSRLDALQAAILGAKLPHLAEWTAARRHNADHYRRLFSEYEFQQCVVLPVESVGAFHVYNQFTVRVRRRDALRDFLKQRGIGTEIYYPLALHEQPAFAYLGCKKGDFPHSELASAEVLSLPIYAELTEEQQEHVVAQIAHFFGKA